MPIQSCFFPYWVTETNHQLVNDGKCVGKKVGHEMTRALFCLFWFWRLGNQRKWTPAPSCAQGQWFDTVCETLSPFSNVWHCCILIQTEWEVSSCQIIFISYLVMSIHFWGRWTLPEFKNSTPRVVFSIIIIIMPVCGVQCTHSSQLHPGAVIWSQGCKAHGPQSMEMNLRVITSKCKHSAKHSDAHQEGAGLLWGMKRHPYAAYISWQLLGFIVAALSGTKTVSAFIVLRCS